MYIRNRFFDLDKNSYIMGILNVTPDSFSDGGSCPTLDDALTKARRMVEEGAAFVDIGGESTRPGHHKISEEEEMERVLPVIERIRQELDVIISLDTYKYEVAKEGILAGADMINDIWGLKWDDRMAGLIAEKGVACCLMHNRREACHNDFEKHFLEDMEATLAITRE
ncbi:MAG: dihydropteroate synthase, partial [Eubacterium sp.]|nr:dihydropteroate synthase [Eubacterium sp.]